MAHTEPLCKKKDEGKKDNQDVDDVFSPKGAVSGGRRKGFFHRLFTIYTNDLAVRCSNAALSPPQLPPPTCCLRLLYAMQ